MLDRNHQKRKRRNVVVFNTIRLEMEEANLVR
jgi:hypothetical protein